MNQFADVIMSLNFEHKEMIKAWREIKQHKSIIFIIDLLFMGLVFCRKEQMRKDLG